MSELAFVPQTKCTLESPNNWKGVPESVAGDPQGKIERRGELRVSDGGVEAAGVEAESNFADVIEGKSLKHVLEI
uniref:Uncharacterized protein n=1 Tax=Nymphaea colorata TaxID=210225 RepID=A0A5K1E3V5_9MAGN